MEPIIHIYTLEINQKSSFGPKGRAKRDFKINSQTFYFIPRLVINSLD